MPVNTIDTVVVAAVWRLLVCIPYINSCSRSGEAAPVCKKHGEVSCYACLRDILLLIRTILRSFVPSCETYVARMPMILSYLEG